MKKYMVSDLVKASGDEQLQEDQRTADRWNVTIQELYCMREISENEADWDDILLAAESLGLGPCEIDYDDVENYLEMGGNNKGELDSSVGLIQWIYDNKLKAYLILMMLGDKPIMYRVEPDMMIEWKNSESMGEYYNAYIRGNMDIEDPEYSCGCGPNPCEPQQVDRFNTRFRSIS